MKKKHTFKQKVKHTVNGFDIGFEHEHNTCIEEFDTIIRPFTQDDFVIERITEIVFCFTTARIENYACYFEIKSPILMSHFKKYYL